MKTWMTMKRWISTVGPGRFVARVALTGGMMLLWSNVAYYLLGSGPSPIILGVVLGYGLTDKIIAAAS
jgi:hypothetical protein